MPIDPSIPLQAQQVNPMASLASMAGLANNLQSLKNNQLKYTSDTQDLQQKQQMISTLADPDNRNPDGSLNYTKLNPKLASVGPLGVQVANQISQNQGLGLQNQGQSTANQSSKFALDKSYADTALQTAAGLAQDPRINVPVGADGNPDPSKYDDKAAAEAVSERYDEMLSKGIPKAQALAAVSPLMMKIHQPGAVQQSLLNTINGMNQPGAAGNGLVTPGSQQSTATDLQGNPVVVSKDQRGNILAPKALPQQGAAPQPQAPNMSFPAGESTQTIPQNIQIRSDANAAAAAAPTIHGNNQQIISLASKTGGLGAGSELAANLKGGYAGLPWTSDDSTNRTLLGHYQALQTTQLAQKAGLNTNQGAEIASKQAGTTDWTAPAIKETAKVNDSLQYGADLFNRGLENAIKSSGSPYVARQFQNKWSQVADMTAMRLYRAQKVNDTEDIKNIVDSMGGPASPKYHEFLATKYEPMMNMVKTGGQ